MMNKQNFEAMADEALDGVSGGTGKTSGWVCAECGETVQAAKVKDGKAYCIPCYWKKFGDPMA